jgi:hypothetical protein
MVKMEEYTPNKKGKVTKNSNAPKPITEQKLFALQETYLKNRDAKTKQEMFHIIMDYSRSLTLKKNKGKVYIPPSRIDEIALDCTLATLEKYNEPSFRMFGSFAGYINWKVLEGLYKPKYEDHNLSLNQKIDEDSCSEMGDLSSRLKFVDVFRKECDVSYDTLGDPFHNDKLLSTLLDDIKNVISEMSSSIPSVKDTFLIKLYLVLFFRKPKDKDCLTKFLDTYITDYGLRKILDLTVLEIRNRITLKI